MLQRLWLLASVALSLSAQQLPPGVQKVTSVEGITEYRLENGLKVLLFPDLTKQTVTVNITYMVGSRHEGYGETGMAHLLEHLLFLGSERHKNMSEEFRKYGARRNGTTWVDRTNYFETVSATDENLRWALDLEADRMVNAFVTKEQLDKEMTVVRNEFEMGENSVGRVLLERTMSSAFLWHNYGKSTIGAKSDLENMPIERLRAFYQKYYQPDNAILTVAGKIDEARTLGYIHELFGRIPRPARKLDRTYTLDPPQDGERTVTVKRVGDSNALMVLYHVPDAAHPDMSALLVLAHLMASAPSGRLHKSLVETKKAAAVDFYLFQLREPGIVLLEATVRKDGDVEQVRSSMLRTIHDVVNEPPTEEEVERAKREGLSRIELMLADSERVGLVLSEPAAAGDWRLLFVSRDRLKAVTPADVLRVAKTYIKEDNRTVGKFLAVDKVDRVEIPPPTDIAAALKDFKGGEAVAQGEVFEATPENIEKRAVRSKLANGMTLVSVPKKTRANSVRAVVRMQFGDEQSLRGWKRIPALTAAMLMRGTRNRTRQQIRDELDSLKARVFPSSRPGYVQFDVETTRASLPRVLTLVAEMLREPSFPADEFEQLRQSNLAASERLRSDPAAIANNAMVQHIMPFPKEDARYIATVDEDIADLKAATLDEVKKFHSSLYGASNGQMAVVGDHDAAEIKGLAEKLFGEWKSPKPFARLAYTYRAVAPANQTFETPDKANANFFAAMPVNINDRHPDFPALTLANYILGGAPGSRLYARIRTKEGLSYGVGSTLSTLRSDETANFIVFAIAAPQNVAKVEAIWKEEIAAALEKGFTETEVAEAKKGWAQAQMVRRSDNQSVASELVELARRERTMAFPSELATKIAALTRDQVNEALKKYVVPDQLSYFKAGDFKKAAAAAPASPSR